MLILYQSLQVTGEDMGIDPAVDSEAWPSRVALPAGCTVIEQMAGKGMAQHMRAYGTGAIPASTASALRYLAAPWRVRCPCCP